MERLIPLTQDKFAKVDEAEFQRFKRYRWYFMTNGYAKREEITIDKRESVMMHQDVLWCPEGFVIDHINGDKLDNRKSNLRVCTQNQNQWNVPKLGTNTSGFKGVSWDKWTGRWIVRITQAGKYYNLGRFDCPLIAAQVYDAKAKELHGIYANLNFPKEK